MLLIYILGTGIGRLLAVGFRKVCVVCRAAAAALAGVRFACLFILLFLFLFFRMDVQCFRRRRPHMRPYPSSSIVTHTLRPIFPAMIPMPKCMRTQWMKEARWARWVICLDSPSGILRFGAALIIRH